MSNARTDRFILLGMDGLDPGILETLMEGGDLPAFARIRDIGSYRRLATSNPSQSPVAWSTMATGSNPGHHGIFDFVTRRPGSYLPEHSIVKANPRNFFARRGSMFLPARKGNPFWATTSGAGVPTTVIRWPVTFPPEEINGRMLSGLGVLDLNGSVGRYVLYTTGAITEDPERKGDVIRVSAHNDRIRTIITGPNSCRIPLEITIDEQGSVITAAVNGTTSRIKVGEWSDWMPLTFGLPFGRQVSGICRFHLAEAVPELRLYLSPIQVDPAKPAFPISYPDDYATELVNSIGGFGTLGIPEDTNALGDGCFDDDAFLDSCGIIMAEREKMLWHELGRFRGGVLAFVFDTTDRIQHMYWRTRDRGHPGYDETYAKKYQGVIPGYYKRMDRVLQAVVEAADERTVICVASDHGFATFRRAVHINSWLVQNGLMALRRPADGQGAPLFENVDWDRTAAYAIGFSGVCLNLKDREQKGVVNPSLEAESIKRKVASVLTGLRDPETGERVVRNVYDGDRLYSGPYVNNAPDLVVGFEPGYRASWQTALGGAPPRVVENNLRKWSGDHMLDPSLIPGVLLMNRKTSSLHPGLIDIAPTILACFGIPQPESMEGTPLLR